MMRVNFKRKRNRKNGGWGVGLDYLLKDSWDDLDKIVEDNFYGRHNAKLINYLFLKIFSALDESILIMKKYDDWIGKAKKIKKRGALAKTLSDKVVFIDTVTQFLRETTMDRVKKPKTFKLKKPIGNQKIQEIKGIVASAGNRSKNIAGTAWIVLGENDLVKVKRGNILVAKETSSDFLPIMLKVKAVVTDLGGILCHAAIVSRELKIPCVVGTKIATQVLKDGDKIQINAKNGRVHKLAF